LKKTSKPASSIDVRLVVETESRGDVSTETKIVTLIEAIEQSSKLGLDLIGVSIEQSPPVIRAQDYAKMAYRASKRASKNEASKKKKPTKEIKFGAGIADNDLARKVGDVLKYLEKGHNCQVTATCRRFFASRNPTALSDLIAKVRDQVGDAGIDVRGIKINAQSTHATLLLQPTSKQGDK